MKTTYELQKMSESIYGRWIKIGEFDSLKKAEYEAYQEFDKADGDFRVIERQDGEWNYRTDWRLNLPGYDLQKQECACCGMETRHRNLLMTRDRYGIPYRMVCKDCFYALMYKGYDGEYYDEEDECLYECY